MGQTIQIWDTDVVGDVLLVSTDRSFTGQDGETYRPGDQIASDAIFPAQLAARLFESDPSVDHVYVMSNVLSIRRKGAWDDSSVDAARETVASFFRFYEDSPPGPVPVDSESPPPAEPETPSEAAGEPEIPPEPSGEAETPTEGKAEPETPPSVEAQT
jgi:hypothetical protein